MLLQLTMYICVILWSHGDSDTNSVQQIVAGTHSINLITTGYCVLCVHVVLFVSIYTIYLLTSGYKIATCKELLIYTIVLSHYICLSALCKNKDSFFLHGLNNQDSLPTNIA